MDQRRLRKFFHFTEDDLVANRRGQFSEQQKKRLSQEAKAEQASARSSAAILSSSRKGLNMVYLAPTKETKSPCPSPQLKITESYDLNKC